MSAGDDIRAQMVEQLLVHRRELFRHPEVISEAAMLWSAPPPLDVAREWLMQQSFAFLQHMVCEVVPAGTDGSLH